MYSYRYRDKELMHSERISNAKDIQQFIDKLFNHLVLACVPNIPVSLFHSFLFPSVINSWPMNIWQGRG
jgi:hypothetical protein